MVVHEYFDIIEPIGLEFNKGVIEFLPRPNEAHQICLGNLLSAMYRHIKAQHLGAITHRVRLKVAKRKYREPDIMFVSAAHEEWVGEKYFRGCDLVCEVVTPSHRRLDLLRKRKEYAAARFPEYWIADPEARTIAVLKLQDTQYIDHGVFKDGERATYIVLPQFSIDVTAAFDID